MVPKPAFRSIEWRSSGFSKPFRVPDGATSAAAGLYPARRRPGGSTAGWRKRQRYGRPMTIARDAMPSPSTQYRASIWRSRTTSAFAPPIRGPCLKNCALFRGRVGTMSCGLGEFRSAHMKSYGADGQASKKLRSMPNRRRGSGDEQPPGTPKHIKPHKSGLLNAGAIAIRCQLKIYLLWAALSQPSSTGLSSSLKFPVNCLSYPTQPPSTPAQCLRTATSFGAGGVRLRWPNL